MILRVLGEFAAWERAIAVAVLRGARPPVSPRRARLIEAAYRDPTATADLVRTPIGVVILLTAHGVTTPIAVASRAVFDLARSVDLGVGLCA